MQKPKIRYGHWMQGEITWFVWRFEVSKNHTVTLLVMSDFSECQTGQGVAACAACQCRILGKG